jgi:hypothetical protein
MGTSDPTKALSISTFPTRSYLFLLRLLLHGRACLSCLFFVSLPLLQTFSMVLPQFILENSVPFLGSFMKALSKNSLHCALEAICD